VKRNEVCKTCIMPQEIKYINLEKINHLKSLDVDEALRELFLRKKQIVVSILN
jgi:hypothetical protein